MDDDDDDDDDDDEDDDDDDDDDDTRLLRPQGDIQTNRQTNRQTVGHRHHVTYDKLCMSYDVESVQLLAKLSVVYVTDKLSITEYIDQTVTACNRRLYY